MDAKAPSGGAGAGPVIKPIRWLGPNPAYDPNQNEAVKLVIEGMQQIGLEVDFQGVPDFGTLDELAQERKYDMLSTGYVGTPPRLEPTELMTPAFSCATEDAANYSGYCNKQFEEYLNTATEVDDPAQRKEAIDNAQLQLATDLPMVVMYNPIVSHLYNTETLSNPVASPASGYFNFWTFMESEPKDGSMTVGISEPGESMNQMCYSGGYSQDAEYQTLVWDTLTRIDRDGSVKNWAASSIERPKDTTVVVTLRPDQKFSDGSALTAEDVAFTYNYLKKWKVGHYINQLNRVKSIKADGADKVVFQLKAPYGPIEFQLFSQVGILPKQVWENVVKRENLKNPCDWKDVNYLGSGPYKLVSTDPNQATRLVRNDAHFQPPKARELVGRYYASQQSLFLDFRAGNVDIHDSDPGFTPSQIKQAKSDKHLSVKRLPSITPRFFSFNMRVGEPFRDYALRKAVAQLTDYDGIVAAILHGDAVPGAGIIAPSNEVWHNDKVQFPAYDVKAAKATLTEAGYTWDGSGRLHAPADREAEEFPSGSAGS